MPKLHSFCMGLLLCCPLTATALGFCDKLYTELLHCSQFECTEFNPIYTQLLTHHKIIGAGPNQTCHYRQSSRAGELNCNFTKSSRLKLAKVGSHIEQQRVSLWQQLFYPSVKTAAKPITPNVFDAEIYQQECQFAPGIYYDLLDKLLVEEMHMDIEAIANGTHPATLF